jgi:hypothetical protein
MSDRDYDFKANLLVVEYFACLVLDATGRILHLAFSLVGISFGFGLGVARQFADGLFDLSLRLLSRTFNAVFIHGHSPSVRGCNEARAPELLDDQVNAGRSDRGTENAILG